MPHNIQQLMQPKYQWVAECLFALRAAASFRLRLAACSLFDILLALMSKQF
jgi:hypothetical protein